MAQSKGSMEQQESKGDWLDFVKDCSKNPDLQKAFRKLITQEGVTAGDLAQFFLDHGYLGVSLADCATLISIKEVKPTFVDVQY